LNTVLVNDTTCFKTGNVPNSNFSVAFKGSSLKLSGLSLLSCYSTQCVYEFDMLGSNDGKNWDLACSVEKDPTYFEDEIRYADCKSKRAYSQYKMMHKKGTTDNSLELYYLELFGDLYINHCIHTRNVRKSVFMNLGLFYIFLI